MRRSRFTEPRIMAVTELCRERGIGTANFYKWRSKYGGLNASMMSQMKVLEDENRWLRCMFADLSTQTERLKEALEKNDTASSTLGVSLRAATSSRLQANAEKAVATTGSASRSSMVLGSMADMVSPCRAFGVSKTCFRHSPKRNAENELIADR
ncbi:transposase (plasmid) [Paracoccus aminophilus JCM 7686]|uniref:Transposase n=1 Tax=Paracoccus aminophilus JCM 7686 TaxID=1367847 RepID=S5YIK9_PARAH|nr:transposase [Paracoccus aminophilus JCM 7686]